jgi:mono/diheme cytochrome c family protein
MLAWNSLFFRPGALKPVDGKSAQWNRGAYLVEGAMHCGMCHTPKNKLGGDKASQRFEGGKLQGWFAPDITNATRRGLGTWSADEIVAYLKTGHNEVAAATGPMAEEVARSSSHMTDDDLHAVAAYLKDGPAKDEQAITPVAATEPAMKMGAAIYADECSACHGPRGTGQGGLFPSLAGSPSVQSRDPTSLTRILLDGTRSVATAGAPTAPAMPSFGWLLNDRDAASVLTYVRNAWGNAAPAVSDSDIQRSRRTLAQGTDATTR